MQTLDLFFRPIFLFFIIEHNSRHVVHVGVTRSPSDEWIAQQIRNATPFGDGPRYLICDNDAKYGLRFERAAAGASIKIVHTPYFAPKANATGERFIGSIRRECLDFILILSEAHARKIIDHRVKLAVGDGFEFQAGRANRWLVGIDPTLKADWIDYVHGYALPALLEITSILSLLR